MFLWMSSPFISGGPLLSLRCLGRVRHCLRLLVSVVYWCVSMLVKLIHALQSALESGQGDRIVQIDFSSAFDRVNHLGILYKLCSVGIGSSVLCILTQFLSNRSEPVMVDGFQSNLVNIVSEVPQGCVLGTLLFLLYTSELFSILKVMLMIPLWWQLWHPQALALQ